MKYREIRDYKNDTRQFYFEITSDEFAKIRLDHIDSLLLKECEVSSSVADKLLALEMIARRIEEVEGKRTEIDLRRRHENPST